MKHNENSKFIKKLLNIFIKIYIKLSYSTEIHLNIIFKLILILII